MMEHWNVLWTNKSQYLYWISVSHGKFTLQFCIMGILSISIWMYLAVTDLLVSTCQHLIPQPIQSIIGSGSMHNHRLETNVPHIMLMFFVVVVMFSLSYSTKELCVHWNYCQWHFQVDFNVKNTENYLNFLEQN
jgi:hypothetical protein